VHETIAADGDPDVRHLPALGDEEHEVTRPDVIRVDRIPLRILLSNDPPQPAPVLREHVLHEATAIEPGRVRAPGAVRGTLESESGRRDGETVELVDRNGPGGAWLARDRARRGAPRRQDANGQRACEHAPAQNVPMTATRDTHVT